MDARRLRFVALATSAALAWLAAVPQARAQSGGEGGQGFLFRPPSSTFGVHLGFDRPSAGSDVFSFVTQQLTLRRSDFAGATVGADLAARLSPRTDLVFSLGYAGAKRSSEYRDWVGTDDLPILQQTTFQRVPLSVGLRAYLTPRGRQVGSLAWVPAKQAFYVGAGAGFMWYRFRQDGEFIDPDTNTAGTHDIFRARYDSDGWTVLLRGVAGVEVALGTRFFLTGEGRYTWAKARLSDSWVGFDRIDLSGLSFAAGIGFRQ